MTWIYIQLILKFIQHVLKILKGILHLGHNLSGNHFSYYDKLIGIFESNYILIDWLPN